MTTSARESVTVPRQPPPACDVVEGCENPSIDVIGGEVWYCAEHEAQSGDAYWAWRNSPERAERVAGGESQYDSAEDPR